MTNQIEAWVQAAPWITFIVFVVVAGIIVYFADPYRNKPYDECYCGKKITTSQPGYRYHCGHPDCIDEHLENFC